MKFGQLIEYNSWNIFVKKNQNFDKKIKIEYISGSII